MNHTVLIVDDDVNARIIAETLLELRGLRVRLATDGTEACEMVRREGAAVVVVNLSLPGMNGFEVLRRLRGRFETLRLPAQPRIVVTSDREEPEVERFALRLGADAFLRKPVAPNRFIAIVEQFIGQTAAGGALAVSSS
jgi:CheY-like chemotaxis protein